MLLLDVLVRYPTVTLLLLIAYLAFRDGRGLRPTKYIILMAVSTSAMLIVKAHPELVPPDPFKLVIQLVSLGSIIFVWWLGLSLFDDNFRLGWMHWTVLVIQAVVLIPIKISEFNGNIVDLTMISLAMDFLYLGLMVHLVIVALKGRADDLMEERRRLRLIFVIAMAIGTSLTVLADNIRAPLHPDFLLTLRALIIFPLALWASTWLSRLHLDQIIFEKQVSPKPSDQTIDPRDKLLFDNLMQTMEQNEIYREPGLKIRNLADNLQAPEHRLRELINKGLGYRNFSAFLNSYRIKAVKQAFAQPENSRIPVLTIAMDTGFNSLAPFNRAFRQSEGMTPSAYRKKVLLESPA